MRARERRGCDRSIGSSSNARVRYLAVSRRGFRVNLPSLPFPSILSFHVININNVAERERGFVRPTLRSRETLLSLEVRFGFICIILVMSFAIASHLSLVSCKYILEGGRGRRRTCVSRSFASFGKQAEAPPPIAIRSRDFSPFSPSLSLHSSSSSSSSSSHLMNKFPMVTCDATSFDHDQNRWQDGSLWMDG